MLGRVSGPISMDLLRSLEFHDMRKPCLPTGALIFRRTAESLLHSSQSRGWGQRTRGGTPSYRRSVVWGFIPGIDRYQKGLLDRPIWPIRRTIVWEPAVPLPGSGVPCLIANPQPRSPVDLLQFHCWAGAVWAKFGWHGMAPTVSRWR